MGRFHTNWLNMMYPRLRLAANLLRDDGVIFISIDDGEVDMDKEGVEKLYFVMETKGIADTWNLRTAEQLKIQCGEQHFKALQNGTSLYVSKLWNEFKTNNL